LFKLIKNFIFNKKYSLKLPNRWNNKKCFDCRIELNKNNFSGWEAFRLINGKEWSVKICDKCLEKQEKIVGKLKYQHYC